MKTINSFFNACRVGAFFRHNTEAWRGYRSTKECKERNITRAKEMWSMIGLKPTKAPENAIEIISDLVVDILDDMRSEKENISGLSTMLREILGLVDCYLTNIESNDSHKGTKRFKYRVSEGVMESLQKGQKPDVIFEHHIPIKVLRDELICECHSREEVYEYLRINLKTAFITKKEDEMLNDIGHKQTIPKCRDRYAEAGIVIHDKPVQFRK